MGKTVEISVIKETQVVASLKALTSKPGNFVGGKEWWRVIRLLCAFAEVHSLDEINNFSYEEWKRKFGKISFEVAVAVQAMVIESASPIDMHWNPGSQPDWRPYQDVLKAHRRVRRLAPK